MSRLSRILLLTLAAAFVVAHPTLVLAGPAGSAWWRFVTPLAPAQNMDFTVDIDPQPGPPFTTGPFVTAADDDTSFEVAVLAAQQICLAPGSECNPADCAVFDVSLPGPAGLYFTVVCGEDPGGADTYRITTNCPGVAPGCTAAFPGSVHIDPIAPIPPDKVKASQLLFTSRFAGDLLDETLVRLDPGGTNGVVTFLVTHTQGGTNPRQFTVNTTGLTDVQIHTAIQNGYNSMGLSGLEAKLKTPAEIIKISAKPGNFGGYGVLLTHPATITEIEVAPVTGQEALIEMVGLPLTTVPTMSEWGIVALIATLLLSGFWMLRRRQRMLST